jgi:hypothetical protein
MPPSEPGYGPALRGRIKELMARTERTIGEEEAEEHARDLDADEVAARAERKRHEREAAEPAANTSPEPGRAAD